MQLLDKQALRSLLPDEDRLRFDDIPPHYLTDALDRVHGQADALAFPLTTEEVSALLRYAHDHDIPVTPRGAGTNLVGSRPRAVLCWTSPVWIACWSWTGTP